MSDLFQQESPLVQIEFGEAKGGGPRIEELPFLGFINLRGRSDNTGFSAGVLKVLGVEAPTMANTVIEAVKIAFTGSARMNGWSSLRRGGKIRLKGFAGSPQWRVLLGGRQFERPHHGSSQRRQRGRDDRVRLSAGSACARIQAGPMRTNSVGKGRHDYFTTGGWQRIRIDHTAQLCRLPTALVAASRARLRIIFTQSKIYPYSE